MYCKFFHPHVVYRENYDSNFLAKQAKMRTDRLDVKSGYYPSGSFVNWYTAYKWCYFGNYIIFSNWRKDTKNNVMSKWDKILWDADKVSFTDVFRFLELCEEMIHWIVQKRIEELKRYYFFCQDFTTKPKQLEFWLINSMGDEKYVFNQIELHDVIVHQFPNVIKHVRCNSCLKLYYDGYHGSETLLCDICCWQWISQLSLKSKIQRLTIFIEKCWRNPKKFVLNPPKRLEKKISYQMDYFIREMKNAKLHLMGIGYVCQTYKHMKHETNEKELPKHFKFLTMCKDDEMEIDDEKTKTTN